MTLVVGFSPLICDRVRAVSHLRYGWRLYFLLFVLVSQIATEFDRDQYQGDNHAKQRNHFKVRHHITSYAFVEHQR